MIAEFIFTTHSNLNFISSAAKEGRTKHIGKRLKKDGSTYWASAILNAILMKHENMLATSA